MKNIFIIIFTFCLLGKGIAQKETKQKKGVEDSYRDFISNYQIPENNFNKRLSWGHEPLMRALIRQFENTGDLFYLEKIVTFCDQILASRNDRKGKHLVYTTNGIDPVWPTFSSQFKVNGEQKYFTNVILTSLLLYPVAMTARLILENQQLADRAIPFGDSILKGSGKTYGEKAAFYLQEVQHTLNHFVLRDWLNPKTKLFTFPSTKRMQDIQSHLAGTVCAYNRGLSMCRVLDEMAKAFTIKGENKNLIKDYQEIVQAHLDYFWEGLETDMVQGKPCYNWYYAGLDRNARQEDQAHGAFDIQILFQLYNWGNNPYQLTKEKLYPFYNTFHYRMYKKKAGSDYTISKFVDGRNYNINRDTIAIPVNRKKLHKTKKILSRYVYLGALEPSFLNEVEKEARKSEKFFPVFLYIQKHINQMD